MYKDWDIRNPLFKSSLLPTDSLNNIIKLIISIIRDVSVVFVTTVRCKRKNVTSFRKDSCMLLFVRVLASSKAPMTPTFEIFRWGIRINIKSCINIIAAFWKLKYVCCNLQYFEFERKGPSLTNSVKVQLRGPYLSSGLVIKSAVVISIFTYFWKLPTSLLEK